MPQACRFRRTAGHRSKKPSVATTAAWYTVALTVAAPAIAQKLYSIEPGGGVTYAPHLQENFPNQVFFGDTHLHTSYSADAGMVGATTTPDDAYRFAKGEEVISSHGVPARLQRPLDSLVVSDHAENLGLAVALDKRTRPSLANRLGQHGHELVEAAGHRGPQRGLRVLDVRDLHARDDPLAGTELGKTMWEPSDRGGRTAQRARRLLGDHRLRMDLDARRQQPAPQRHLPRRQGRSPTRSSRFAPTTPTTPRSSGSGWPTTRRGPAAVCWPSRTTATSLTA